MTRSSEKYVNLGLFYFSTGYRTGQCFIKITLMVFKGREGKWLTPHYPLTGKLNFTISFTYFSEVPACFPSYWLLLLLLSFNIMLFRFFMFSIIFFIINIPSARSPQTLFPFAESPELRRPRCIVQKKIQIAYDESVWYDFLFKNVHLYIRF